MKRHATHCKFCKIPITLEIADDYDVLADPRKLIPLASCNHCADLRVERRNIEGSLGSQCAAIGLIKSARKELPRNARINIDILTKQYARLIARWNRLEGMAWEEGIVDAILDDPHHWGDVAGRMWKMCRKPNQVERTEE